MERVKDTEVMPTEPWENLPTALMARRPRMVLNGRLVLDGRAVSVPSLASVRTAGQGLHADGMGVRLPTRVIVPDPHAMSEVSHDLPLTCVAPGCKGVACVAFVQAWSPQPPPYLGNPCPETLVVVLCTPRPTTSSLRFSALPGCMTKLAVAGEETPAPFAAELAPIPSSIAMLWALSCPGRCC